MACPGGRAAIFVTIQSFSYLNDYVGSGGKMQAITFGPAALLVVSLFYGAWVIPSLLALAGRRATDWAMLVLGGLLVTMSTLGGVSDELSSHSTPSLRLTIKVHNQDLANLSLACSERRDASPWQPAG